MNIIEANKSFINKFTDFSGRATRSEFWWSAFSFLLIANIFSVIDEKMYWMWMFITFIPLLAVGCRRNNDAGFEAWYSILPVVNLYFWVQPSIDGAAKPEPVQEVYTYKEPVKVEPIKIEQPKVEPVKAAPIEPIKVEQPKPIPVKQPVQAATIEEDDPSTAFAITGALLVVAFLISVS